LELRVTVEPHEGATYAQQLAIAQACERLGFGAFFRSDHFLSHGIGESPSMTGSGLPGPTDAWTTLAAIARETKTIRLGTLMTCASFRQPAVLAVIVAQVDEMSEGRVELGLGCGWFEPEYQSLGIPFPPTSRRYDSFEEQVQIILGLWRTSPGERFSFTGDYYRLSDNPALPRPTQDGGPPLIVGGMGKRRTPAFAARWASEFNSPFGPPQAARERFELVTLACEQIGRDPASLSFSHVTSVSTGSSAREVAQRVARTGKTLEELSEFGVVGQPEQVVERLLEYRQAGADRFYVQITDFDDLEHLELIAAEILPHVQ
jgi:F420-dependent oxidoreductase-like protein